MVAYVDCRCMAAHTPTIADLLHEVGETHHQVFRITDGTDDDWASWYADWLISHSELPDLLGATPVRSEAELRMTYAHYAVPGTPRHHPRRRVRRLRRAEGRS